MLDIAIRENWSIKKLQSYIKKVAIHELAHCLTDGYFCAKHSEEIAKKEEKLHAK